MTKKNQRPNKLSFFLIKLINLHYLIRFIFYIFGFGEFGHCCIDERTIQRPIVSVAGHLHKGCQVSLWDVQAS